MSAALWSGEAMRAAMAARADGPLPAAVTGLSIDSRTIAPGEAYFAILGERLDGHDFVPAALNAGAALCVVAAERAEEFAGSGPLLVVPDVLQGLRDLARAARERSSAAIVAVTGSVGKTSTKEALRLALGASGEAHASAASFNNHWGVPLSLARLPESARFAVFEIGMNHAGEITPLVGMVRPHVAVVTTVGPVHLEFFDSEEGIADAKAEIFSGLEPGGTAILNRDNRHCDRLIARAREAGVADIVTFGRDSSADIRLLSFTPGASGSEMDVALFGRPLRYQLGLPGEHLALNSLAVLAAAERLGADVERAAEALSALRAPKGRGARVSLSLPDGEATLIDESYNANPASMRAAIAVLADVRPSGEGRRIAVLGDMRELGASAPELHAALAEPLLAAGVEHVYTAGPLMRHLASRLPGASARHVPDSTELVDALLADLRAGDVVMVKGSLGSRMGLVVEALKTRFAPSAAEPQQGGA